MSRTVALVGGLLSGRSGVRELPGLSIGAVRRRTPNRDRSESGAVLVIVLIFLVVFGLIIGSLLTFSDANIRTTRVLKSFDGRVYGADAGIEYGISTLQSQPVLCGDTLSG